MERDVMDIVKDKEYIELTAAERAELGEMCSSEEEFNQVKSMFAGFSAMDWSNPTPKTETKERLDVLFAQKHPKAAPIWYNAPLAVIAPKGKPFYRQPLIQAAAVGLLIFLAYPLVNSNVMNSDTKQVAVLEKDAGTKGSQSEKKVLEEKSEDSKEVGGNEVDETAIDTRYKSEDQQDVKTLVDVSAPKRKADVSSMGVFSTTTAIAANEVVFAAKDVSLAGGAAQPGSTHPDGIFIEDRAQLFSAPASREPAVFDLLTSTF